MIKFRIIKKTEILRNGEELDYYYIQKKRFIFWHYCCEELIPDCITHRREFDTYEDAKEFIDELKKMSGFKTVQTREEIVYEDQ